MPDKPPYLFPGLLLIAGLALIGAGVIAVTEERRAMENDDADLGDEPEIDTPPEDIAAANTRVDNPTSSGESISLLTVDS